MDIPNEIKTKILAKYSGQKAKLTRIDSKDDIYIGEHPELRNRHNNSSIKSYKLILKPLSSLTDADAKWIGSILTHRDSKKNDVEEGRLFVDNILNNDRLSFNYLTPNIIWAIQYLEEYGYDLPQYFLEGRTLHEAGLAIYKE